MTKVRVTIDLEQADKALNKFTSLLGGSYGVDQDGAYGMWYGDRNDLIEVKDVEIVEDSGHGPSYGWKKPKSESEYD